MTDSNQVLDANANSSAANDASLDDLFSDNSASPGATEDSLASDTPAEQELASGSDPVDAKPEAIPEPKEEVKTNDLSPGIKKRIDKLTARAKQAEEQARKQILEKELEASQYKQAFQLLQKKFQDREARLAQLEEVHPTVAENERLKFENEIRTTQEQLNAEYQRKVQEAQKQAKVAAMTEQLLEEVEIAVSKYPTVSEAEIAFAMKRNPKAKIEDLAKQIHEDRYKRLEQEFTAKYKDRLNAPKPVTPNGSTTKRVLRNDDDVISELDAMFGPDWNQRK